MAFYKDINKGTRQDRRRAAEARGGFEDEGARYGARSGQDAPRAQGGYRGRPASGNRPAPGGYRGENPRPAEGRDYRGKPANGNRPAPGGYRGDRPAPERGYRGENPRPAEGRPGEYRGRPAGGNRPAPGGYRGDRPAPGGYRDDREERRNDSSRPQRGTRPGEYRFTTGSAQPYRGRGEGTAPRSFNEQRQARREDAPRGYGSYRYEPPVKPAPVPVAPIAPAEEVVPYENLLSGRNPIREALKSGRDLEKLMVARGELSGSAREIVAMAKEARVPVQEVDRVRLDAITPNHQGMIAFASAYQYHTVEEMLALADERGEAPMLVLLDGVTDPHNLGAIIRTAECAGAHGVIVQERRAVGLTPAAVKASAGAIEHIMVARVPNLVRTIAELQKRNVWAYAADMSGESYTGVDFSGGVALVIGAEGEGVSRLVLETCDRRVSLPIRGQLDSLNASVAAGVLLYAILRTR